jgi:methyltransferase
MYLLLLLLLAAQRGLELILASSNTAHLRRRGAREVGSGHYPVLVALHVAWFLALILERCQQQTVFCPRTMLLGWAFLLWGQGMRWWTIITLGRRWSTRILVLPGAPRVENGPFRLLGHPNYLGVWLEIVGVPLIGGCWRTALWLGALHTLFLLFRIRLENAALRGAEALGEPLSAGRQ